MKNKKTIIFDFDGTLVDSFDFTINLLVKEGRKFHYNLDKEEIKEMMREESLNAIIKKYKLSKIHIFYIVWKIRKDFQKISENVKIYPLMKNLLLELDKNYTLLILTSNDKKHVEKILKRSKVLHCFKELYFKSSLRGKANYLEKIIKKHNLKKEEVVYIGDELRDFEASQKIGIDCVNVSYGFNSKKLLETENKDLVVNNVGQLRKLFL